MPRHSFMNIAHRGASSYAPENTFSAFDRAIALGIDQVELDVHFTRDGHIVVIHDDLVDRTTNGTGPVANHTLEQLQALDAGAWFGPEYAGERIPSFREVLERYRDKFHYHIEIKAAAEGLTQATIDLVRDFGLTDRATITSFQLIRLVEARAYAPELPAGWLVRDWDDSTLPQAKELRLSQVCPRADLVTPQLVAEVHQAGFRVRAWGVGAEDLMRQVVDSEADGMTVNFPDKLTAYLQTR